MQDILNTFLTSLPGQLTHLQDASLKKDYDNLFFHAHKLKGSCGMLQASPLIDKLSLIQKLAREKSDASGAVEEVAELFEELLQQLKKEITI
jgi:HPt (histidine-containing phosphotransfer) domain-containing protein